MGNPTRPSMLIRAPRRPTAGLHPADFGRRPDPAKRGGGHDASMPLRKAPSGIQRAPTCGSRAILARCDSVAGMF
jgi:hypothetical protein